MATPEALVKYYDCLKDSFNKIQDKDNEVALINAALRPKIREELAKSDVLLNSYLNYIQVFCLIYNEKFNNVCSSVICPLFKEHKVKVKDEETAKTTTATKLHQTIQHIVTNSPGLTEEFAYCVVKVFPSLERAETGEFYTYLENSLQMCTYLEGEPMSIILCKILERLNPPKSNGDSSDAEKPVEAHVLESYDILYDFFKKLNPIVRAKVVKSLLVIVARDLLREMSSNMCHLITYVCSLDPEYAESLISLLWDTFTDVSKPLGERRASVEFASFFLARAKYITLEDLLNYLETTSNWCHEFLEDHSNIDIPSGTNERIDAFYAVAQSIFYLITQRYREMYEDETISSLNKMRLDKIICNRLRPLEHCDKTVEEKFREVDSLYKLFNISEFDATPIKKRRLSTDLSRSRSRFVLMADDDTPQEVRPLYRFFYEPKNFTIYRE